MNRIVCPVYYTIWRKPYGILKKIDAKRKKEYI